LQRFAKNDVESNQTSTEIEKNNAVIMQKFRLTPDRDIIQTALITEIKCLNQGHFRI